MRIDVQLRRDVRPLQGQVHHYTVLGAGHRIVARMHQEDRWCLFGNPKVGREDILVDLFTCGLLFNEIARIDRDREIRPATYFVDLVNGLIGALVKLRRCGNGQVSARREAEDSDPVRIDAPFRSPAPHQTDRSLRVQQWTRQRAAAQVAPDDGGTRYLSTTPVTPTVFNQAATSSPSRSQAKFQ